MVKANTNNDLRIWLSLGLGTLLDRIRIRIGTQRYSHHLEEIETVCLFLGYPRSGHSVIGSCIDAHPNAVIAHRLDAVKFLAKGRPNHELFYLLLRNAQHFSSTGRVLTGYAYPIPNQSQGRVSTLKVVGDQEGNWTSRRLGADLELTRKLLNSCSPRYRLVHVIRNPYDNITTWALRSRCGLNRRTADYFALCEAVSRVLNVAPENSIFSVYYEQFVASPKEVLQRLLKFLGLPVEDSFLSDCAAIISETPHKSRFAKRWSNKQINEVLRQSSDFEFLSGYRYQD
jgi:hypothetical protein